VYSLTVTSVNAHQCYSFTVANAVQLSRRWQCGWFGSRTAFARKL